MSEDDKGGLEVLIEDTLRDRDESGVGVASSDEREVEFGKSEDEISI